MIEIRKTEAYTRWLDGLRDIRARARVLARVERSHQEIRAMLNRLGKESLNCE
jgi:putative component of toxin-antitoxin plasmid stabilization module